MVGLPSAGFAGMCSGVPLLCLQGSGFLPRPVQACLIRLARPLRSASASLSDYDIAVDPARRLTVGGIEQGELGAWVSGRAASP